MRGDAPAPGVSCVLNAGSVTLQRVPTAASIVCVSVAIAVKEIHRKAVVAVSVAVTTTIALSSMHSKKARR